MARVEVARQALLDLERLFGFNPASGRADRDSLRKLRNVRKMFALLAVHPVLGHPAEDGRRVLILGRGPLAYIAKYRWIAAHRAVLILAVDYQSFAGYGEE